MPKVSVLLPVYNTDERHLRECLESLLNQTYSDFELIVLNDASSDEQVEKTVFSYADPRLKYFKNDVNLGISGTRNSLLQKACGEYIAVMDHDDVALPTRFEKQVGFLETNPDVGIVGSWYETFPVCKVKRKPADSQSIEQALFWSCPVLHPSVLMRKSLPLYYEACFSPAEDLALYCRLVGKTKFANIQEVLLRYRGHSANASKLFSGKMLAASKAVRNQLKKEHPGLYRRSVLGRLKFYLVRLFAASEKK